ncbi:hypothetical protein [Brevundimonas sp.]|jgi:antitoxin VapB|uniref:hypothetical protein n=1 Tax=Brevundimonas sp. TaxID=1871086 RepID=UPI002E112986|nr:hypothetical protein [Brevundimonas sp.]
MDGSHPIRVTIEGDHQVVHLPRDVVVPPHAVVREEAGRLVIETAPKTISGAEFAAFLRTLEPIDEEIGEIEDFPARPFNL